MGHAIRRKKYVVDRSMQLRFSRFVVILSFASAILTGLAIFFTTFSMLGGKLADVYPQGRLVTIFQSVYGVFFVSLLVILPIIFYGSIVFSHRIAGPLPKIYQALEAIGNGNFDIKLTLRKSDELRSLGDVINETARKLRERETKQ
jgi:methyl-accepting chemotaxis protein